ncbi:MAG: WbqC family protein, partial [gamma proteobacterium endosymbiont of Lamellibrachia anaximandri]|nr:WbqC family protein [gamma proteobacterium endosymbiont of Lamellibrachia anaximandri]
MSKIGAIIQSSYLPWKGYFDIINDVDLFVFMDDVQFTTRNWRNRNLIKTKQGPLWLTVPVGAKRNRLIQDVEINQYHWQQEHYKSLKHHYGKAPFFHYVEALINEIFSEEVRGNLSQVNQHIIKTIAQQYLGVRTDFINAALPLFGWVTFIYPPPQDIDPILQGGSILHWQTAPCCGNLCY